jgi:ABC-type multidrug transport system permease subunit
MPVLFFPGMLFFSVMLLGMGLSADVWKERACGALRRLGTVPASAAAFLAGKMLSTTLVMALVGAVAVGCGRWMLGMPFVNLGGAVAWVAFFGLFFYSLLMLLQVHVDSQRAANVVSNLIVFPMAMIGGTFFPFEVMPKWMASAGRMTPTGWAVVQLKAILNGKTEPRALALAFAGLATVTVAAYILSLRRLRSFR